MSFIATVPEGEATGAVKDLYAAAEARHGYIPNYLRLFSHRPEVYAAWRALETAICGNMSLRRYELVTVAAARKLGGSYCMLAHGSKLLASGEVDESQLAAIAVDYRLARLAPEEVAVMEFAEKVVEQASCVTQMDVDRLKSLGLSDAEILDITLAATARCFFAKTLDALDAEPDAKYLEFDAPLRRALAVGRPFGDLR
jgi:uncharacterized peroxidase-related enzyme